jgi:hypothetical protein
MLAILPQQCKYSPQGSGITAKMHWIFNAYTIQKVLPRKSHPLLKDCVNYSSGPFFDRLTAHGNFRRCIPPIATLFLIMLHTLIPILTTITIRCVRCKIDRLEVVLQRTLKVTIPSIHGCSTKTPLSASKTSLCKA